MTWARRGGPVEVSKRFADAKAALDEHEAVLNDRATRTVAGHALDAVDCAQLLHMLGLRGPEVTSRGE